jgi:hypothetical protein
MLITTTTTTIKMLRSYRSLNNKQHVIQNEEQSEES